MKNYRSSPLQVKTSQFELDDKTYTFTHPKRAALVAPIFATATLQDKDDGNMQHLSNFYVFFLRGLGKGHIATAKRDGHVEYVEGCQACEIVARLDDDDDDLDTEQIGEIINDLIAESGDRPTN